jgi:hypothetical protein
MAQQKRITNTKLSPQARTAFERDGFTILRKVILDREQSDFLSVVRGMITERAIAAGMADSVGPPPTDLRAFFSDYVPAVDREDHRIIKLIYDSCYQTIAGRALFANPTIVRVCADLVGCESLRLYLNSDRLRIDPPGPTPFRLGWHQESAYTASRARSVQYWGPLLWPSSWENGSVEIAIGSHRLGQIENISRERREVGAQQFLVPDDIVYRHDVKLVEIEPGDVIVFSCNLIHRSSDPTRQRRMKYSITGRFADASSPKFDPDVLVRQLKP